MKVPFLDLKGQFQDVLPEIEPAILDILQSCNFIGGKYVEDFEKNMEAFLDVKHVLGC